MSKTVADVMAAIQTFNLTITGIVNAPATPPPSLAGWDLPTVVTAPAAGRWWSGKGLARQWKTDRIYQATFYLAVVTPSGENVGDFYTTYLTWIDTVGAFYRTLSQLGDPNDPLGLVRRSDSAAEALTDSGPLVLQYLSDPSSYYGFTVQIPVGEFADL